MSKSHIARLRLQGEKTEGAMIRAAERSPDRIGGDVPNPKDRAARMFENRQERISQMSNETLANVCQFVIDHAERGACRCGKCIDQPSENQQPKGHTVDMVFFEVCAKNNPEPNRFRELVVASKQGEFGELDPWDGKEHSYIEVGRWIGDQGLALMLMGLGAVLGLWGLMTPKMLPGLPDDLVMQMAGAGMVTIMPPKVELDKQ